MQEEIRSIKENESDINPYGSTNEAEFFAVAAEYFFERPELFEKKHPELFTMLEKYLSNLNNSAVGDIINYETNKIKSKLVNACSNSFYYFLHHHLLYSCRRISG